MSQKCNRNVLLLHTSKFQISLLSILYNAISFLILFRVTTFINFDVLKRSSLKPALQFPLVKTTVTEVITTEEEQITPVDIGVL